MLSKSDNLISRGLSLETLEPPIGDEDECGQGVQLVDRVLVLIAEPCKTDPHPEGDTPNTLGPNGLVEPGVDPDMLGSHLLLRKLLDLLQKKAVQIQNQEQF